MPFGEVIEAQLRGKTVVFGLLVKVEFVSETFHLWTGVGKRTFGGAVYEGVGAIAEISDITRLENGQADPFEIKLAATEEAIQLAMIEFNTEAKNQPIEVYLQFFEPEADIALDQPWLLRDGTITGVSMAVSQEEMSLTVACDTITSSRGRPAYGMFSDRDQKARYPGDRGLEFVSGLNGKSITWPDF